MQSKKCDHTEITQASCYYNSDGSYNITGTCSKCGAHLVFENCRATQSRLIGSKDGLIRSEMTFEGFALDS